MKLSLQITGLLCAGMLITSAVSAAELTGTLKRIQESGTMTLGYREASVPFSYLQADGTPPAMALRSARPSAKPSRRNSTCRT